MTEFLVLDAVTAQNKWRQWSCPKKALASRHCTRPRHHVVLPQTVACTTSMPRGLQPWRRINEVWRLAIRDPACRFGACRPMATADTPRRPLPGPSAVTPRYHVRKEMAGYLVSQLVKFHHRPDILGWSGPVRPLGGVLGKVQVSFVVAGWIRWAVCPELGDTRPFSKHNRSFVLLNLTLV